MLVGLSAAMILGSSGVTEVTAAGVELPLSLQVCNMSV